MKITFFLRGPSRVDWEVPQPDNFNFYLMVKAIRSDGHFVTENLYINGADITAIAVEGQEITTERKVTRLAS